MSYIINGTEVKVGQVWEQRNGDRCVISRIADDIRDVYFPIDWVSVSSDDCGSVNKQGEEYHDEETDSDLIHCIVESEPVSTINQPKEQSMQNRIAQTPNLQIEDLHKTVEEPQYKTWGDLPDGTFVMNDDEVVFLVNKVGTYAAYSLCGFRVRTCCDEFGSEDKIIKVKLQILE